jgi:hypothetical protein
MFFQSCVVIDVLIVHIVIIKKTEGRTSHSEKVFFVIP